MQKNNKKFWSLVIGCLLTNAYLSLVELGLSAQVPASFHRNVDFIVNYYPYLVTASLALCLTTLIAVLMPKFVNTRVSDHVLWLILPSISFLVFTSFTAHVLLPQLVFAAIPSLAVIALFYLIEKRDSYLPARDKVW
ncbi:hypothetical protein ACFSJY_00685 [Thalassotalea euphylliae]|uniref:hypothetical protein n=1 Tax=Thalassotalea euphylliae TaxID=1655234 RepID=UPI00363A32B3